MKPSIAAYILTFIANVATGIVMLIALIVVMNGFMERDARWGIWTYIIAMILASVTLPLMAMFSVNQLMRRGMKGLTSGAIAVAGFSIIGFVVDLGLIFLAAMIAELMRNSR